jgi:hypothetical protein
MKLHTATIKATHQFTRNCSNCRHSWVSQQVVSSESDAVMSTGEAKSQAAKRYNKNRDIADRSNGVLCPACGHFSELALKHHFAKGYRRGLTWIYWKNCICTLLAALGVGVVAVLMFGLGRAAYDAGGLWSVLGCVLIFFGVGGGIIVLLQFGLAIAAIALGPIVHYKLRKSTEERARILATNIYKANRHSLRHLFASDMELQGIWIRKMLGVLKAD